MIFAPCILCKQNVEEVYVSCIKNNNIKNNNKIVDYELVGPTIKQPDYNMFAVCEKCNYFYRFYGSGNELFNNHYFIVVVLKNIHNYINLYNQIFNNSSDYLKLNQFKILMSLLYNIQDEFYINMIMVQMNNSLFLEYGKELISNTKKIKIGSCIMMTAC